MYMHETDWKIPFHDNVMGGKSRSTLKNNEWSGSLNMVDYLDSPGFAVVETVINGFPEECGRMEFTIESNSDSDRTLIVQLMEERSQNYIRSKNILVKRGVNSYKIPLCKKWYIRNMIGEKVGDASNNWNPSQTQQLRFLLYDKELSQFKIGLPVKIKAN